MFGKTLGGMIEAIGHAVAHPLPGFAKFQDHGEHRRADDYRKIAADVRDLCDRLQLRDMHVEARNDHVFIASNYGAPNTKDPAHWLSIKEAHKLRVCRICREPGNPKQRDDGTMNTFYTGHGHEYAHEDCLTPEAMKRMYEKIRETGPHRGD